MHDFFLFLFLVENDRMHSFRIAKIDISRGKVKKTKIERINSTHQNSKVRFRFIAMPSI